MSEQPTPALKPEWKKEDVLAASLIIRLAALNRDEALERLVPLVSAARLWAEQELEKKDAENEG